MENCNKIEANNGENELLEETIQRIQSFLCAKEAAQTTILSKSWYEAWLTRPNLDFAERNFPRHGSNESAFVKFATKTMQRYDELKLKIQSFRIQIDMEKCDDVSYKISLAEELITQAMKLGPTDLDIKLTELVGGNELTGGKWDDFVLPHEVLESETLVKLFLYGCTVDHHKVSCSNLRSLSLIGVRIHGDSLWDIISICPSIEKLVLCRCNDNYETLELKRAQFRVVYFHKLKVLWLEDVEIGEWFFGKISKFPCLKELTLDYCIGYKEIQICSTSLEYINITEAWIIKSSRINLDVPKIRMFKYSSFWVPSLSFKTGSREWTSEISIRGWTSGTKLETLWFEKLRNFLLDLRPSKIFLSLWIYVDSIDLEEGCDYTDDIIIPRVEKLMLSISTQSKSSRKVLENIFLSCRPKVLTLTSHKDNDFLKLLCNTLMEKVSDHKNQNMPAALHDLAEVNVEFFEDDVIAGPRLLPWKTWSEASENSGKDGMKVCLQLKWVES